MSSLWTESNIKNALNHDQGQVLGVCVGGVVGMINAMCIMIKRIEKQKLQLNSLETRK